MNVLAMLGFHISQFLRTFLELNYFTTSKIMRKRNKLNNLVNKF